VEPQVHQEVVEQVEPLGQMVQEVQVGLVERLEVVVPLVHLQPAEQVVQMVQGELVVRLGPVVLVEVLVQVEQVGLQELQEHQVHLEHRAPQVKMVYLEDLYTI